MFSLHDTTRLRSLLRNVLAAKGVRLWIRLIDTQSMSPALSGNVFLLVELTTSPNFQIGDLILFSSPLSRLLVVHRVCHVQAKGPEVQILQLADRLMDENDLGGSWIPAGSILGRVVAIRWGEPGAKVTQLTSWLHRVFGRQIAILSAQKWMSAKQPNTNRERESFKESFKRKTLMRIAVHVLHGVFSYIYMLLLRASAGKGDGH